MDTRRIVIGAVAVAGASVLSAPAASAQAVESEAAEAAFDEGGEFAMFGAGGGARISKPEIAVWQRVLALDDDQKTALADLHGAYDTSLRAAGRKMAEYRQAVFGNDPASYADREKMKEHMEVARKYGEHTQKLRDQFLSDVQLLLTPVQQESWPRIERRLRRNEFMERMSFQSASGARADLVALTEGALASEPMPEEAVRLLDEYERDLDHLLEPLREWTEETERSAMEQAPDLTEAPMEEQMQFGMKMILEARSKTRPIRELNLRMLNRIGGVLSEAQRDRLEDAFYRTAFMPVWGWGMRGEGGAGAADTIERTLKLGSLTPEQKEQIERLRDETAEEGRARLKKQAEAIMAKEDDAEKNAGDRPVWEVMFDYQAVMDMQNDQREADTRTLDRLRALLTPEQTDEIGPPLTQKPVEKPTFDE